MSATAISATQRRPRKPRRHRTSAGSIGSQRLLSGNRGSPWPGLGNYNIGLGNLGGFQFGNAGGFNAWAPPAAAATTSGLPTPATTSVSGLSGHNQRGFGSWNSSTASTGPFNSGTNSRLFSSGTRTSALATRASGTPGSTAGVGNTGPRNSGTGNWGLWNPGTGVGVASGLLQHRWLQRGQHQHHRQRGHRQHRQLTPAAPTPAASTTATSIPASTPQHYNTGFYNTGDVNTNVIRGNFSNGAFWPSDHQGQWDAHYPVTVPQIPLLNFSLQHSVSTPSISTSVPLPSTASDSAITSALRGHRFSVGPSSFRGSPAPYHGRRYQHRRPAVHPRYPSRSPGAGGRHPLLDIHHLISETRPPAPLGLLQLQHGSSSGFGNVGANNSGLEHRFRRHRKLWLAELRLAAQYGWSELGRHRLRLPAPVRTSRRRLT